MISLDKLYSRDNGRCWLCKGPVNRHEASRDHIIPKSKGGDNQAWNLRLAHRKCNTKRGNPGPHWAEAENIREFAEDVFKCAGIRVGQLGK